MPLRPRGGKKSKYVYQPVVGVKVDFETLLQRFSAAGTVRYEKFAEIWREMKLSLYCAGRQTQRESKEYVEECFRIAVQFCLPPSSFLVRAGALYLLYGLYYFQLVAPKSKIRLTAEEWLLIHEFQNEAREQQHLDLDYIFQKMKLEKAFICVATPSEIYPGPKESADMNMIPDNLKEDSNVIDDIFSSSALNQLALVNDQYHKMKLALNGENAAKPDSSLDIIHQDLIQGVYKTLQVHKERQLNAMSGHANKSEDLDTSGGEEDRTYRSQSVRKRLKRKAFEVSPGYFKEKLKPGRPRKNPGVEAGSSADSEGLSSDMTSPKQLRVEKKHHGRKAQVKLYEKDDVDKLGDVDIPKLNEVFNMPDLDKIIPNIPTVSEPENTSTEMDSDTEINPSSKGKAPLKGKVLKKGQKGKEQTETNSKTTDSKTDASFSEIPKKKKKKKILKTIVKNEMRNENITDVETEINGSGAKAESTSSGKKKKKKTSVGLTSPKQKDTVNSPNTGTVKSVKTVKPVKGSGKKKNKSSKTVSYDDGNESVEEVKELTAQEKLQMKLNKRKKEARMSKSASKK